ncbi:AtpZ/AtpI family protein [Maribacter sp. 2-571]|uniref:AtpZ/AtpI family protein n=1 Tax=Maribacter sp. 2-571 TaxID=3417569 RepID=UPI003D32ED37
MDRQKPRKHNKFNAYARFSGMVFQMVGIIFVGSYIGVKLDERFPNDTNWLTVVCALTSVLLSIYMVIRNINSASKDK